MFPLDKREIGDPFWHSSEGHQRRGLGIATDYVAVYDNLYAPFDGKVDTWHGDQGGNWLRLTRDNGDRIEFAHLDSYHVIAGRVKEGDLLATTGNTGIITSNPHLHVQVFVNGKRVDPEEYPWENEDMSKIEELKQQVRRLHVEVRKLTKKVHKANARADALEDMLEEERLQHKETVRRADTNHSLWQKEIDRRKQEEKKRKLCEKNRFESYTILEKIRALFI